MIITQEALQTLYTHDEGFYHNSKDTHNSSSLNDLISTYKDK